MRFSETLLFLRIFLYYFETNLAMGMTKNNEKTLQVTNNNGSGSSEKAIKSSCRELSHGCECGVASCENCPGTLRIEEESDSDMVYRNIFSYLKIIAVILISTFIIKEALTLLSV